jgi:hypothetical protein
MMKTSDLRRAIAEVGAHSEHTRLYGFDNDTHPRRFALVVELPGGIDDDEATKVLEHIASAAEDKLMNYGHGSVVGTYEEEWT